jgi:hypothetical protein
LVVLSLATWACGGADPASTEATDAAQVTAESPAPAAAAEDDVSVSDLLEEPGAYFGREVTIEGDAERVLAPLALAISEEPLDTGRDNDLLVLVRQSPDAPAFDDGWVDERVRVTGIVSNASLADVERELGWDLDATAEKEFEGRRAVLIASAVTRVSQQ